MLGKMILYIVVSFIFTSSASAGELLGGGTDDQNCPDNSGKTGNYYQSGDYGLKGYSVFSIEAPSRKKIEPGKRGSMSDDKELTDSLKIFLGLGRSGQPECLKAPKDRGVQKSE